MQPIYNVQPVQIEKEYVQVPVQVEVPVPYEVTKTEYVQVPVPVEVTKVVPEYIT